MHLHIIFYCGILIISVAKEILSEMKKEEIKFTKNKIIFATKLGFKSHYLYTRLKYEYRKEKEKTLSILSISGEKQSRSLCPNTLRMSKLLLKEELINGK